METRIRQATADDVAVAASILGEAASWLEARGMAMWRTGETSAERAATDIAQGLFFLAEHDGEPAGTIKFQLADDEFWPDVPAGESAFMHRLAVRRRFAGLGVSTALMTWAVERTRSLGLRYLRLDCEAERRRLRDVYERFGFELHSYRLVGPYYVSRYQFTIPQERREGP